MKALTYIVIPMLLISGSCASTLYTGAEYDDLYYSPSDQPAVKERVTVNDQVAANELQSNNYYDNIYAGDTLVADRYSSPSDYDDQIIVNNNMGGSGYDYYDDSYANRLSMFHGNYFNPYWDDPYYFNFGYSYGSPYFGFGFNYGYPYYGLGIGFSFSWGYPYYGWGYPSYGYGYPYYGYGYPYYGYGYPYYGYGCCYPYYGYSEGYYPSYGRRERPSNLSSNYNDNMGTAGRRSTDGTGGTYSTTGRRAYPGGAAASTAVADSRRSSTGSGSRISQEGVKSEGGTARSSSAATRSQSDTRPEYKSANRSYTPSYNNPRMSTRPSYNNSRVSDGSGSKAGASRNFNNSYPSRSSQGRAINQNSGSSNRSSSFGNMQRRYSTPSSSSRQYSTPSVRRSSEGSRSYSSGSSSRSSFGSGSSSGSSRSSSSGGSSFGGGGGGGRSSSSSHSSGSRR